MKFLADGNFPRPAVYALREHGFEVVSATEDSPGSADEDVLARCANHELTLLTLDKDFGELVGVFFTVAGEGRIRMTPLRAPGGAS